jgi:2-keto-4-pentenoate hydratase
MGFSSGEALRALAEHLEGARIRAVAIDPPAQLATLNLSRAYDLQDALVAVRVAAGARQSGWKLGITSPVKQRVMGIDHPLFGRTFADGERAGGERIAHASFVAPRTEPELAFGLAGAIEPGMDGAALGALVAWVAPALEITDSRFTPGRRTAVELVADNTSSSAYVIGPRIAAREAGELGSFATDLVLNGTVVNRGTTADVLGDPRNALLALAAHLAARDLRTRAGDVVLSGAITDAIAVAPGDVVEARLAGLGAAAVTFV